MTARVRAGVTALAAAVALVVVACAGNDPYAPLADPGTISTVAPRETLPADYTTAVLEPVQGSTTTAPPALGPGPISLVGIVQGPNGPVPNAVVHIERLVGVASVVVEVPSAADGSWNLMNVLGGRYRVRAWQQPNLLMTKPEIFFADGTGQKAIDLRLEQYGGTVVSSAMAPNPPPVNQSVNLVVRLAVRQVGADGVARPVPLQYAQVQLDGSGRWVAQSANPVLSDASGNATFRLQCLAPGRQPLRVIVDGVEEDALDVPDCYRPEPTTTTTTSPATTTTTSSVTTTTR